MIIIESQGFNIIYKIVVESIRCLLNPNNFNEITKFLWNSTNFNEIILLLEQKSE